MKSEFALKCYQVLSTVPAGTVISYSELAKRAGKPKAARAVGSIMSKNPFAPHIPCHRVVRADGNIGQYLFGSTSKRQLLVEEGVQFTSNGKVLPSKQNDVLVAKV